MSYLIYFGIMVATGGALMLMSDAFRYEVSRGVEAVFERIEYRLALRARAREIYRQETRIANVTPFLRSGEVRRVAKGSTQPLSIARIAA